MTAALKVVEMFPNGVADDIAAMLRQSAEKIETETEDHNRTVAIIAVQVFEEGNVTVLGWGKTDKFHALGSLMKGVADLTHPEDQL
jgi:hypothetical protein